MPTTPPGPMRRSLTATKQSVSESKTRAGPRWWSRSWPASFPTQPSGGRGPPREGGHDRRPVGNRPELVELERDPELVGDGEEVEDAVRGAACRGDRGDRVVDRGAGHDVARPGVVAGGGHGPPAGRPPPGR